jgi:hypothetical protein
MLVSFHTCKTHGWLVVSNICEQCATFFKHLWYHIHHIPNEKHLVSVFFSLVQSPGRFSLGKVPEIPKLRRPSSGCRDVKNTPLAPWDPWAPGRELYEGFLQWGYPNSWIVYFMENPMKMDYLYVFFKNFIIYKAYKGMLSCIHSDDVDMIGIWQLLTHFQSCIADLFWMIGIQTNHWELTARFRGSADQLDHRSVVQYVIVILVQLKVL